MSKTLIFIGGHLGKFLALGWKQILSITDIPRTYDSLHHVLHMFSINGFLTVTGIFISSLHDDGRRERYRAKEKHTAKIFTEVQTDRGR